MINEKELVNELVALLPRKESKEYYAKKLNVTRQEVEHLLAIVRNKNTTDTITKKVNLDKGTIESTLVLTYEPKDDVELAKLHKIDLTKYVITNYWSKVLPNGKFTSSVFSKLIPEEVKEKEDLLETIKTVFTSTKRLVNKQKYFKKSDKALFVYIADDHAGIDFKESLFGAPYTGDIYMNRLRVLSQEILSLNDTIDTLYLVNLGDELDGFNKQTTRGGHELSSLSNKEQFNIYTTARKEFYDSLLLSEKFKNVVIININNSNHSGNDYSYIVNKSLEFYLDARYDNITFINQEKIIESYNWGEHTILLTHGKDQTHMKFGMPLNLNEKTDLWLMDYSKDLPGKYISTVKGDLHAYSVNMGKSGRYINVPSICGGSPWIEANYGSSSSGALLEVVDKQNKNITSIPIWF